MAVDKPKIYLPDINEPFGYVNGEPVYLDLEWYQALEQLAALVNATKDEVDTQHP